MTALPSTFQIQGRFAGFFRDVYGNRRMVVMQGEEEIYFEFSKALYRKVEPGLTVGQEVEVEVRGENSASEAEARCRRVVSEVRLAQPPVPKGTCMIRVCGNSTCWRNGGQALFGELQRRIAESGLSDVVRVKASPCMDLCKQGPNAEVEGREFYRCSVHTADALLRPFTECLPVATNEILCLQASEPD